MEALVIFGEGKGFSAGAELAEFALKKHLKPPILREIVDASGRLPIPRSGWHSRILLRGALALALGCHYRMADRSAKIGFRR